MRAVQKGQRGALVTTRDASCGKHAIQGSLLVALHDLKMAVARWVLSTVGYDLDAMIHLAESTSYEETIRIAWTIDGRCTLREWLAAGKARRISAVRMMETQKRSLLRRPLLQGRRRGG